MSVVFLKLIYRGAGTAVHLLLLKFSMVTTKSRLYSGKLFEESICWHSRYKQYQNEREPWSIFMGGDL